MALTTTDTDECGLFLLANWRNDVHTVKVGVNYRFNWGGSVVAKY